jgi:hypothetical protein
MNRPCHFLIKNGKRWRRDGTGVCIRSWTVRYVRKLPKATIRSVMPVCLSVCLSFFQSICLSVFFSLYVCLSARPPACKQLALTGQFLENQIFQCFFENLLRKFNLIKVTTVPSTLHKYLFTFKIIPCWILLRMRQFSEEIYTENKKTHFMFSNLLPTIVALMQ